ncbi:MAG: hypothetical protein M1546_02665 [Chloroflexi bacterium]|nr:hypothetical protein [Chloroflexota bacterium]
MFEPLPDLYLLCEQRYSDFLREADQARLARLATAQQSTLVSCWLAKLGDLFISLGNSLKRRDQHEAPYMYTPLFQIGRKGEL